MKLVFLPTLLLLIASFNSASAWDNDDLEIFDLVELINDNFYKVMGIQQVFITWIQKTSVSDNYFLIPGRNISRNQTCIQKSFDPTSSRQKFS